MRSVVGGRRGCARVVSAAHTGGYHTPDMSDDSTPAAKVQHRFAGTVNAPEFPPELAWINTDRPIRLADLRGKLVVLDFWTFC